MSLFKRKEKQSKSYIENNKTSSKYFTVLRRAEEVAEKVLERAETLNLKTQKDFEKATNEFKQKLQNGNTLDDILIDVFAVGYKAVKHVYGLTLYKVQIMGGYAIHQGDIAEMKTGEGKTLTAILPVYLNALEGKGVHVITVNEYLSQRDAFNTGKVFALLGLTTGSVTSEQSPQEKQVEYYKDITYITNSELGFDYLRDNMVADIKQKTQRGFNFAIVDEVDSILIDEARTPLIISQGNQETEEIYLSADEFAKSLDEDDYIKDHETKSVYLTDSGVNKAEEFFNLENLYSFKNSQLVHRIFNALQANYLYSLDTDYTVKDDEIVLIDIFTGRLLPGRSFSEGLNQAIEAKEAVKIKPETKTIAVITYQNLFRMYKKLSGMTGTALTEEEEFINIYNMRVISIPTNLPVVRDDLADLVFASKRVKFEMVVKRIEEIHQKGQPVLVGTKSVFDSELLSELLHEKKLEHEVLNAKNNAREAEIIARAGQQNAITISTNMAGRGTDIKLGEGVVELGGLFVLGTERYESRRIDNQLKGRSGRQGDPGVSQFYISLEDDIFLRAGLKRIQRFMGGLDREPIASRFITRSITVSQKKIEGINYDYRKNVVEYDDVMNRQRLIVYAQRDSILSSKDTINLYESFLKNFSSQVLSYEQFYIDGKFSLDAFINYFKEGIFANDLDLLNNSNLQIMSEDDMKSWIESALITLFERYSKEIEDDQLKLILRHNLISILDSNWQEQINDLSRLRSGIHYRQYAQQNPVQVYILEADEMFSFFKWKILEQSSLVINFLKYYAKNKDKLTLNKNLKNNGHQDDESIKELLVS